MAVSVSEEETYGAIRNLARSEGPFVEPGAAVAVAAYRKMITQKVISEGERVVLVLTGHGLKDPDALASAAKEGPTPALVEPGDVEAMGEALEVRG
jgi:threonine synthase